MDCTRCDEAAVMHAAYAGTHLCEGHFLESVERRVRRRVREDDLLPDSASPDDPQTWVIGLSGGKDSVVLASILSETFAMDPRVRLVALTVHEGIEGYRDESLEACERLIEDLDIHHVTVSYAEEYGIEMDDVVERDPNDMAPCAYCGVFRRDVLSRHARELGADKLLTGHNLDDVAQTALMNVLEGDVAQMASHYDASLGSFDNRMLRDGLVPRAKPLRDVPEKEIGLYCQLRDLPAHMVECPHASESFRKELQGILHRLEEAHPGTRHSIMAGYEELAAMAARRYREEDTERSACRSCGEPTHRELCRACSLADALHAAGD